MIPCFSVTVYRKKKRIRNKKDTDEWQIRRTTFTWNNRKEKYTNKWTDWTYHKFRFFKFDKSSSAKVTDGGSHDIFVFLVNEWYKQIQKISFTFVKISQNISMNSCICMNIIAQTYSYNKFTLYKCGRSFYYNTWFEICCW